MRANSTQNELVMKCSRIDPQIDKSNKKNQPAEREKERKKASKKDMETDTKPLNRMVNDINARRQVKILKPLWLLLLHVCTTVGMCVRTFFFWLCKGNDSNLIFYNRKCAFFTTSWIVVCIAYSAIQLSWFYLNIFSSFQLKSMQNQTDTRNNNNCTENQAAFCANMDKSIAIVEEANE